MNTTTLPIHLNLIYYFLPTFLSLYLFLILIKFLHKVWWNPILITRSFAAQGVKGPSYKFFHGNTKEILKMTTESMSKPMEEFSHDILPVLQPHIHSWIKLYGKTCITWHGPTARLIVTDTDLVKEILNNKDGTYPKMKAEEFTKRLFGDGLGTAQGQKWVKQRKIANHAFHGQSLKGTIPTIITTVEAMLDRWRNQEGKEIELLEEFKVLTSEVISKTAFGSSYVQGKKIFELLIKLVYLIFVNSYRMRFPGISKIVPSKDDIESEKIEKVIERLILEIIKRREETAKKGDLDAEGYGNDYLGLLLNAHHDSDESKRITVQDLIDECKTFYIASHETSSSFLTWTCLLLATNTDWQEKVRKEVIELFGSQNLVPDDSSMSRLKTMNMIMNESLRLYPPVNYLLRSVTRNVRLGKLNLPANVNVMISTVAIHHDQDIWGDDVHLFKPERFAEGVARATNNNPMAFLPFGAGPRICVGSNFALMQGKIALAMILQRYHFTISPAYVHSPTHGISARPQHGLQVILHRL